MFKAKLSQPEMPDMPKPTLPHVFRSKDYGELVLFFDEERGVLLDPGTTNQNVGKSGGWISCWDNYTWAPLRTGESVTLVSE